MCQGHLGVGEVVHGDISRFLQGDPTAGTFMTGFFPIMMFGLPAAAFAIYRCARPENRKVVGGDSRQLIYVPMAGNADVTTGSAAPAASAIVPIEATAEDAPNPGARPARQPRGGEGR